MGVTRVLDLCLLAELEEMNHFLWGRVRRTSVEHEHDDTAGNEEDHASVEENGEHDAMVENNEFGATHRQSRGRCLQTELEEFVSGALNETTPPPTNGFAWGRCMQSKMEASSGDDDEDEAICEIPTLEAYSHYCDNENEIDGAERENGIDGTDDGDIIEIDDESSDDGHADGEAYTVQSDDGDDDPPPDFNKMTVVQLRKECRDSHLPVTGKKQELVDRLMGLEQPKAVVDLDLRVIITHEDVSFFGLIHVGFEEDRQSVREQLNNKRFRAHFGVESRAVKDVLGMLREEFSDFTFKEFMMTLNWLKSCELVSE